MASRGARAGAEVPSTRLRCGRSGRRAALSSGALDRGQNLGGKRLRALIRQARRPKRRGRPRPRPAGVLAREGAASRAEHGRAVPRAPVVRSPPPTPPAREGLSGKGDRLGRRVGDEPAGQGVERARGRGFAHALGSKAFAESAGLSRLRRNGAGASTSASARPEWTRSYQQSAGRRSRGLIAGDDEALGRAGHGDIEKSAMFARLSVSRLGSRGGDRVGVLGRLPGPGEQRRFARPRRREPHQLGFVPGVGAAARVGQKDDRRLEPLAGVDRQHAHALRLDLHVALDLDVGRFDLGEKIVQRRRLALLVRQRQGQEFVDRVGGFGAEPADQRPPAAVLAEQQRVKGEGRKRPSLALAMRRGDARRRGRRPRPQPRAPPASEPLRRAAIFISASSSKPISGDLSAQASVRSSSGSSAARPAAMRSMTAIWSLSLSRSAPAAFRSAAFSARIIASKKALRLRTRIMTSLSRMRLISPEAGSTTRSGEVGSQPALDDFSDPLGEDHRGVVLRRRGRAACASLPGRASGLGAIGGHSSTTPFR